jgi:hypothetical protein
MLKILAEFRDGWVMASHYIFFRMENVVAGPILNCLGDFHRTAPQRDFGILFPKRA